MKSRKANFIEQPPIWILILLTAVIFIFVIIGPRGLINKAVDVFHEITSPFLPESDEKNSTLNLANQEHALKYMRNMYDLVNFGRYGTGYSRCLIPISDVIGAPDDLGDFQIHLQSSDVSGTKTVRALVLSKGKEIGNVDAPINDVNTCLVGESDTYDNFKKNFNLEDSTYKDYARGAEPYWPDRRDGTIILLHNNKIKVGDKGDYGFETENLYLYKADSQHVCFLKDTSDEDKYLTSKIPSCSTASGGDRKGYDCTKTSGNTVYFFNAGELYCENHDPSDKIVECAKGNKWNEFKTKERIPSCYGNGIPYTKQDSCCCSGDKCIHQFDQTTGKITECGAPEYGTDWEERQCTEDETYRVGWVLNGN